MCLVEVEAVICLPGLSLHTVPSPLGAQFQGRVSRSAGWTWTPGLEKLLPGGCGSSVPLNPMPSHHPSRAMQVSGCGTIVLSLLLLPGLSDLAGCQGERGIGAATVD